MAAVGASYRETGGTHDPVNCGERTNITMDWLGAADPRLGGG